MLHVEMKENGGTLHVALKGGLDENSTLPAIEKSYSRVEIDLNHLERINSIGCRDWINWSKKIKAKEGVFLLNCPSVFVAQMSILVGMLSPGMHVASFLVPYYCEECGHEEIKTFHCNPKTLEFDSTEIEDSIGCPKCGALMTIDVVRERYLSFLKA